MRKKKIIVGNWKMNPSTSDEARRLTQKIKRAVGRLGRATAVICPAEVHLMLVSKLVRYGNLSVGVQDVFWEDTGFHTGEVSAKMAYDAGARFAIVGHSEKRKLGETDEIVSKKAQAAIKDRLTAIICVGESVRDRDGAYLAFLENQIRKSLAGLSRQDVGKHVIVAYEPIWEIGRKDMQAMSPSEIHETALFIKKVLTDLFGREAADRVPVLYGGSVSKNNAKASVFTADVDGLLIGRQSLDAAAFIQILRDVNGG